MVIGDVEIAAGTYRATQTPSSGLTFSESGSFSGPAIGAPLAAIAGNGCLALGAGAIANYPSLAGNLGDPAKIADGTFACSEGYSRQIGMEANGTFIALGASLNGGLGLFGSNTNLVDINLDPASGPGDLADAGAPPP